MDPELVTFLQEVLPGAWNERRHQVGRMDYCTPEILYAESELGSLAYLEAYRGPRDRTAKGGDCLRFR